MPVSNSGKASWVDPSTGNRYTAGGILFYDENGIWVIEEKSKYSDIGGRYTPEDCSIFGCIARELSEETYMTCQLLPRSIELLYKKCRSVYLTDTEGRPVYVCILVPVRVVNGRVSISDRGKSIPVDSLCLDPKSFQLARNRTLSENPSTPEDKFTVQKLLYIEFSNLRSRRLMVSTRLEGILAVAKLDQQH